MLAVLVGGCAGQVSVNRAPTPSELARLRQQAGDGGGEDAQVALGAALRAAGQRDSARAVLGRVVAANPRSAPGVLNLALTEDDLGQDSAAADLYRRFLALGGSERLKGAIRSRLAHLRRQELVAAVRGALAREAQLSQSPPEPRNLAIFPFLYAGSDPQYAPLSRALSSLLTTDLSQTRRLRVLERTQVQLLIDEIGLSDSGLVDPATAVRSGQLLHAGRVVEGRIGGGADELRISAAVVGVGTDLGSLAPVQAQARVTRLFDMEKQIALGLYDAMGIQLTPAERERVEHRATGNLQALLAFGSGLEALDAGRFSEAAGHFRKAAALDPSFREAATREREAEALSSGETQTPERLAEAAAESGSGPPSPSLVDRQIRTGPVSVVGLDPVMVLLPDPIARNPGSEILGMDGLSIPAMPVVIISRP